MGITMSKQFNRAESILNKDKCKAYSIDCFKAELQKFLCNYMNVNQASLKVTMLDKGFEMRINVVAEGFCDFNILA